MYHANYSGRISLIKRWQPCCHFFNSAGVAPMPVL
nr:MAG TPA: hypothetical protein [Caudoviricetes sp.]